MEDTKEVSTPDDGTQEKVSSKNDQTNDVDEVADGKAAQEGEPQSGGTTLPPEVTKESIRQKVWDYLQENNLVNYPRPPHHRIPNFKDAVVAGDKAATLEVFKKAGTIKINPDKPQEQPRFLTLEANKTLLVPTPRLKSGLFNKIVPPKGHGKEMLRTCASSQGVKEYSVPVGLDSKVKVDLVVTGCVAVSKKGYRIGKGEGFADLEYSMMRAMGAVDKDTLIITTVHDSQIQDIPAELLGAHDITVDYIVTPTQIIECPGHSKPEGIIWSLLTQEKLRQVPVLKRLRYTELKAGKDVRLKGEIEQPSLSDLEDEHKSEDDAMKSKEGGRRRQDEGGRRSGGRGRRPGGRGRRERKSSANENKESKSESKDDAEDDGKERHEDGGERRRDGDRRRNRKRQNFSDVGSIYVGSLPRSLRVSEFKTKIREKDVNPLRVVWHGGSGHAFLQFQTTDEMESALETLTGLEIGGKVLRIETAKSSRPKGSEKQETASADSSDVEHVPKTEVETDPVQKEEKD